MKFLKFSLILALVIGSTMFYGCGGQEADQATDDATEQVEQAPVEGAAPATEEQGPEYTSKYVCPMHCEGSGSEEAGNCPVCGMEYVLNENLEEGHDHDGHDHDHGDEGEM